MIFKRSLLLCCAALVPCAAIAAETPMGLEQIIVVAKKRRQNGQQVPQAIDVVRGASLRQYGLREFEDLQKLVSGLRLSDNGGRGQNVTLRGVTYNPDTTANPSVDIYVNEVPISQTSSAFQDLFDIEQIEVIRGPQGTLRGRTSPAGAILIDTARPDLTATHGEAAQTISDNGLWRTEAAITVPVIADKLAVRLAGLFDQNNLYGTHNITTGQRDYNLQHAVRLSIEAKPLDDLDIVIMHQASNDRTRELFAVVGDGAHGIITPADNIALHHGPYTFYNRTDLTTMQMTLHLGSADITYIGGYQALKDNFQETQDSTNLLPGFNVGVQTLDNALEQLTQEIRLQSRGDQRLQYMGGFYFAHQDAEANLFVPSAVAFAPAPGTPLGVRPVDNVNASVRIPQIATDYAIFTDETYKLTDEDIFEGGLRWQFEKQYRANDITVVIPPVFGGGGFSQALVSPHNQKEEYRAWTGLASYTHRFTPHAQIYASYGQSFRPGGVVLGISVPLPEDFLLFRPESSFDFEIGGKTTWLDGRLRVNADIFHQSYSDYIGRLNNLYTTYNYQSVTTSGDAIVRGAEISANTALTDLWRVDVSGTYSDAHYAAARLPCNDFAGTGHPNTTGTPAVTGGGVSSYCITNGSLGAPPFSFSLSSEYAMPVRDGVEAYVRGLYAFTPATRVDLTATNQDPRNILNLYMGLRGTATAWEATLFLKNALGVVGYSNLVGQQHLTGYTLSGDALNFDTGYRSSAIERPREFGAILGYRF